MFYGVNALIVYKESTNISELSKSNVDTMQSKLNHKYMSIPKDSIAFVV